MSNINEKITALCHEKIFTKKKFGLKFQLIYFIKLSLIKTVSMGHYYIYGLDHKPIKLK